MANATIAEDDPYLGINLENDSLYKKTVVQYNRQTNNLQTVARYWTMWANLLLFLLYLVNISAGLFLLIMIMKYKALRTTVNMIIFHCVLNILFFYLVAITFAIEMDYRKVWICTLDTLTPIFLSLAFMFAGFLSMDWYIAHFKPNQLQTYKKIYKYILIAVYSLGLLKFLGTIVLCHVKLYNVTHIILLLVYTIVFIAINTVDYYAITRNKLDNHVDATYSLIISNVIVYSWLWLGTYDLAKRLLPLTPLYTPFHKYFITFTQIIPDIMAHGNLIAVVYLLGRLNKQFKMAYDAALMSKFRDYGPNELDRYEGDITAQHEVHDDAVHVEYEDDKKKTIESTNQP